MSKCKCRTCGKEMTYIQWYSHGADCKAKQEEEVLKPCPFCGSNDLSMSAFSFSEDCYVSCTCGAMIETSVPWEDMNETEHDAKCFGILKKAWNTRAGDNNGI